MLKIKVFALLAVLFVALTVATFSSGSATEEVEVSLDLPSGWSNAEPNYYFYWNGDTWLIENWGNPVPTINDVVMMGLPAVVSASSPEGQTRWLRFIGATPGSGIAVLGGPTAEGVDTGSPPTPTMYVLVEGVGVLTAKYGRAGPAIDVLRAEVIKFPDVQLVAMQTGELDVLTDMRRTGDIDKLMVDGFTITSAPGFHLGSIGYNIRPNRDYLTPPYACNPAAAEALSDIWFRKALFHLYDQEEICTLVYGYTVTSIHSLVPPAQGVWVNPGVRKPPHSWELAREALESHGYVYDAEIDNWRMPSGDPVPTIKLWSPIYVGGPFSDPTAERFVQELNDFGLTSIVHEPRELAPYMDDVDLGDFDMYMVFWSLGRFPDHLYYMCHSSCDVVFHPPYRICNTPGIWDPELDQALEVMMQNLDFEQRVAAAREAQRILNDETHPRAAFSYMPLYSRNYFNAYNPDLRGIVNAPGYGSDNDWTHLSVHWMSGAERLTPDGETIITWLWAEEPELLNPCSASTVYTWAIIDKVLDGLIAVGPYTNADVQWFAQDWEVVKWPDAGPMGETYMNFTFWLRQDIFWQDGNPYTAHDAAFNWRFLKNNQIPQYEYMWHALVDVDVMDNYTVTAIMDSEDQLHLYDLSETAALLPPPVWSMLDGRPLATIIEYDPSANTTTPADAGPWFGAGKGFPSTQLYGTGPFVFEHYDPALQSADFHQSVSYFQTTDEIAELKTVLFHEIGDTNRDGYIDIFDLSALGVAYGKRAGWPGYDPNADLNSDGIIDGRDLALVCYHWDEQREYP